MVVFPVLIPFFLTFLKREGLPERLSWWKSLGAGLVSYLIVLVFAWLGGFTRGILPSFMRDLLFWAVSGFLPLGLGAALGFLLFRTGSFTPFLDERTLFPFLMGLYLPTGLDNIVRYVHYQDAYVLFALPVSELLFLLIVGILFQMALDNQGGSRLLLNLLLIPAAFLFALVPALYYSAFFPAALLVLLLTIAAVAWLTIRSSLIA